MNNILKEKYENKILLYYAVLLAILVSWTDTSIVAPPMVLRIIYSLLFFIPFFSRISYFPGLFIVFFTIRCNSVAPFGYLPSTPVLYFIAAVLILLLGRNANRNIMPDKYTNKLYLSILIYIFLINLLNVNLDFGFLISMSFAYLLYRYFLVDEKSIFFFGIGFVCFSVVLSIYMLIFSNQFSQQVYVGNYELGAERAYWIDPNYMGSVIGASLIISLSILLEFYIKKISIFLKIILIANILLSSICLFFLASRGSILSVSITLLFFVLLSKSKISKKLVLIGVFLITLFIMYSSGIMDATLQRFNDTDNGSGRTIIWAGSLIRFINQNPFLIFFGGGTNWTLALSGKLFMLKGGISSHNEYLQFLFDYGIVGLLLFLSLFYKIYSRSRYRKMGGIILIYILSSIFTICPFNLSIFPYLLAFGLALGSKEIIQQ